MGIVRLKFHSQVLSDMGTLMEKEQSKGQEYLWKIWVDNKQRIVSFHEVEGFLLFEFHDEDFYLDFLEQYSKGDYRFQ